MRIARLDATTAGAFTALFEGAHVPCFCRYWHFTGTKNDWLERCALRPEESRDEQLALAGTGDGSARGLLAFDVIDGASRPVGWLKIAPRSAMSKLHSLPVYRGLHLDDASEDRAGERDVDAVHCIGCMLVAPEARGRGVARALVLAADDAVRGWGGRIIEAYPRRATSPLYAEEAWQGPESLFVACGYEAVHDVAPYPVYRKRLTAASR